MCLAIPMRLIERGEYDGVVEIDGVQRNVSLMLCDDCEVGEHLLIHAGYAIGKVDAEEAEKTIALLREHSDHMEDL